MHRSDLRRSDRIAIPLRRTGLLAIGAAMFCSIGCQLPAAQLQPVRVSYRFDNVRADASIDEWKQLRRVLMTHAAGNKVEDRAVVGSERTVGGTIVRQYLADLTVANLDDLKAIDRDIRALSKQKFNGGERVEFEFLHASANLAYASSFIMTGLDIILRGVTSPGAQVTIYLHDGSKRRPDVSRYGKWSLPVKVRPNHRYFYGYATGKESRVTKYFRIDIFSQEQEDVTADRFEGLRRRVR
ncbi:MAG: hypothetical protein ACPGXK_03520 [Phycisphaerae bacterium]